MLLKTHFKIKHVTNWSVLNKHHSNSILKVGGKIILVCSLDPGCHVMVRKNLCDKEINRHSALHFHITRIFTVETDCTDIVWKGRKKQGISRQEASLKNFGVFSRTSTWSFLSALCSCLADTNERFHVHTNYSKYLMSFLRCIYTSKKWLSPSMPQCCRGKENVPTLCWKRNDFEFSCS